MTFATWKIKEKSFALVYYTLTEFAWTTIWPLLPLIQALNFPLRRVTQNFAVSHGIGSALTSWPRSIKLKITPPPGGEGDCFSAEHQPVFSQVLKDSAHAFTYSANLNKSWCSTQAVVNQMHTEPPGDTLPQASRYFGYCPEQVMDNYKRSLKIQTPLFLTSLQEPS